ncbi:MAG: hypothetical protein OSJ51_11885 [Parabacteroides distasonis]|nr:hypothetical protein [Parabacteroides distasonis]
MNRSRLPPVPAHGSTHRALPQQIAQLPDTFLRRILSIWTKLEILFKVLKRKWDSTGSSAKPVPPRRFSAFLFQTHLHIAPAYDITNPTAHPTTSKCKKNAPKRPYTFPNAIRPGNPP